MSSYKKFSNSEVNILKEVFKNSNYYPSKRKVKDLAKSFKTSPLRIENWLKYHRRKLYFNGGFCEYKVRKTFSPKELAYLKEKFNESKNPDFKECQEISKNLNLSTSGYQIKNWFANQRRKSKILTVKNAGRSELNDDTEKTTNSCEKQKQETKVERKKILKKRDFLSRTNSSLNQINFLKKQKHQKIKKNKINKTNSKSDENLRSNSNSSKNENSNMELDDLRTQNISLSNFNNNSAYLQANHQNYLFNPKCKVPQNADSTSQERQMQVPQSIIMSNNVPYLNSYNNLNNKRSVFL